MSSAPPPVPAGPAPRKKPSALASCILLVLILGAVGVMAGGGYWAYRNFVAKPVTTLASSTPPPPTSAPTTASPTPTDPTTPAASPPTQKRPSVLETVQPATTTPDDPLAAPVDPAATAAANSKPETITPGTTPQPDPTATAAVTPAPDSSTSPVVPAPVTPDDPSNPLPEPDLEAAANNPDPVVAAEPIETLPEDSPEVAALKADADRRIDEAPAELYSDSDKQRVRDAIRHARRLTKVATLRFGNGSSVLGANERNRLKKALLTTEAEALLSDSQAVLFILGFADATGTAQANQTISQKRAVGVGDVLKSYKVANTSYAVGIGATTLLSSERQSQNRAVEVWIVQP